MGPGEERAMLKRRLHLLSATVLIAAIQAVPSVSAIRVWFIKLGVAHHTVSLLPLPTPYCNCHLHVFSLSKILCYRRRLTLVDIGPQSTTKCLPSELNDYLLSLYHRLLWSLNERERRKRLLDHDHLEITIGCFRRWCPRTFKHHKHI